MILALGTQAPVCNSAQLLVYQGEEPVHGVHFAAAKLNEEVGDGFHRCLALGDSKMLRAVRLRNETGTGVTNRSPRTLSGIVSVRAAIVKAFLSFPQCDRANAKSSPSSSNSIVRHVRTIGST